MNTAVLRRALAAESALAGVYSRVERRPWGLLCHNTANPGHYDANSAREIRTTADAAPAMVDEIVDFYHGRSLTPRANLDALTAPPGLGRVFAERGFRVESTPMRLMVWEGAPPPLPALTPGTRIDVAGPADAPAVTAVQAEGFGYTADPSWIRGYLPHTLSHPGVRCLLARVDGEPAASGNLVQLTDVGLVEGVATRPAFRRRGLATALTAHIQAVAAGPLVLWVTEENAQRIYARAGFRVELESTSTMAWLPG